MHQLISACMVSEVDSRLGIGSLMDEAKTQLGNWHLKMRFRRIMKTTVSKKDWKGLLERHAHPGFQIIEK